MLIGRSLREARVSQGLSLRDLAAKVDVSASFVSQVENGKAQPSVATLYQLANTLGLSLDAIVDGANGEHSSAEEEQRLGHAVRASHRGRNPICRVSERRSIELDSGVAWEQLALDPDRYTDFLFVTYAPGGASATGTALMRHAGTEFGLILEGTLEVTLAFETHTLNVGDSIAFPSGSPHRLHNPGDVDVKAVWIVVGRDGEASLPH